MQRERAGRVVEAQAPQLREPGGGLGLERPAEPRLERGGELGGAVEPLPQALERRARVRVL
ncbi:MAG TPA: hypothetical protein VF894_06525, partial [Anaeromyxobacter sp.]